MKQLIPSFRMVWVLSCSILRGGLVFDMFYPSRWIGFYPVPSFEVALFLICSILRDGLGFILFHPSRWLREPSEGRELLVLKSVSPLPSSCFSEDWPFGGCLRILSRAAPHFLCKLTPESGILFSLRGMVFGGRLQCCAEASPPSLAVLL